MDTMDACARHTAPVLCLDFSEHPHCGLMVLPCAESPDCLRLVQPSDAPEAHAFWQKEIARHGLPAPELTAVSIDAPLPDHMSWAEFWSDRLHRTGGNPALWFHDTFRPDDPLRNLFPAPFETGCRVLVAHSTTAALLGALALPHLAARTRRQGVVVIHFGTRHVTAFLVYRERVYGIYEHNADRNLAALLADLKEFRLAWLPDEVVRRSGGSGCVFFRPTPDEAESFDPVFIVGTERARLAGHGQVVTTDDEVWIRCHGLAHGVSLYTE